MQVASPALFGILETMRQREPAICLRTSDYSETSQVVQFITRGAGQVRLLAKGAKRPRSKTGGAIDLLSEGELVFIPSQRESLGTLVEFSETVSRAPLRSSAARLNAALYMSELTAALVPEGDPHVAVFDLLHNALVRLGQPEAPLPAVLAFFQWRLLKHVGLLGDLTACVVCGERLVGPRPGNAESASFHVEPAGVEALGGSDSAAISFSSIQGGLLCRQCRSSVSERYPLEPATVAGIAAMLAVEAGQRATLPEEPANSLNRLLSYHASHQLGRPLRMARHAIPKS